MKDYASMSDQQINQLVIEAMVKVGLFTDEHGDVSGREYVSDGWCWGPGVKTNLVKDGKPFITHHNGRKLDYCNNPADAWPVIVTNKINIEFEGDVIDGKEEWWSIASWGRTATEHQFHSDENPLRAAMIVFLMMKEGEND